MGSWGTGSFENDDALDWLNDFSEDQSFARIEKALDKIDGKDYEEYDWWDISFAVVACEVIAGVMGRLSSNIPNQFINEEEAKNWDVQIKQINFEALGPYLNPEIISKAERVLLQLKSEGKILRDDMFIDSKDYYQWLGDLQELKNRIAD